MPQRRLDIAEHAPHVARLRRQVDRTLQVRLGLTGSAVLQQDTTEVGERLHVVGVDLQRPPERLFRSLPVSRLPGRDPEHVMAPHVLRLLLAVRLEEARGMRVVTFPEDRLRLLVGHRPTEGLRLRGVRRRRRDRYALRGGADRAGLRRGLPQGPGRLPRTVVLASARGDAQGEDGHDRRERPATSTRSDGDDLLVRHGASSLRASVDAVRVALAGMDGQGRGHALEGDSSSV